MLKNTASIRRQTNKPFGLNFLLFAICDENFSAALELRPPILQFAWVKPEQDLRSYFDRSHEAGALVTYMTATVPEAKRAAEDGADIIIAQGTEGGGHVGWMARCRFSPWWSTRSRRSRCLRPAAMRTPAALSPRWRSAQRPFLLGTRLLATVESPLHAGREWALRRDRAEAAEKLVAARRTGGVDEGPLSMGRTPVSSTTFRRLVRSSPASWGKRRNC